MLYHRLTLGLGIALPVTQIEKVYFVVIILLFPTLNSTS